MTITRNDHDDLNATLTLILEKGDYEPAFMQEIKKYKKQAQLKGFRKGKTPISAVKKMFGKSALAEVINKLIDEHLTKYIQDEKLDILGSPIPSDDQEMYDFNLKELADYTFKFDVGKVPDIQVKGIGDGVSYLKYKIDIPDDLVQEEFDMRKKRLGTSEDIEDSIEEDDILTIKAVELEEGNKKENGWETDFTIMVNRIGDEDLKKKVLSMKKGDTFEFDINKIEKEADETYVKKYLLQMDESEEKEIGNLFEGLIENASRRIDAEINDDFFEKAFPETDIKTEEAAKEHLKVELGEFYEKQTTSLTYREIMDKLMDINGIDVPADFLKRWLIMTNENVTQENIDQEFEGFQKNLEWTLIKSKLAKEYEVAVEPDEVRAHVKGKIQNYLQGYQGGEFDYEPMIDRFLSSRDQIEKEYSEVEAEKLFETLIDKVELDQKNVSIEEFKEIVEKINEKVEA